MERTIERFIYASRRVLVPNDLWKFLQEIFHVLSIIAAMKEADLVLVALSLNVAESHLISHLMWYVIIPIKFVLSAFGMGMLDKPTRHG